MLSTLFETSLTAWSPFLLFGFFFLLRFVLFSYIENKLYAHKFKQKEVFLPDLGSALFYMIVVFPVAMYLSNWIVTSPFSFPNIDTVSIFVRIFLYFFVADFLHYWIHRLMHLPLLWRIHMWHHSPTHMSWLAGFRASILDATVVNVAFILAWPLLGTVDHTTRLVVLLLGVLVNDWMHLNIRFRFRFLENFLITPRYHHIHHSNDQKHYTKNLAAIFPIWDKLFGTYSDPDLVKEEITFGLNKKRSRTRLVSGL